MTDSIRGTGIDAEAYGRFFLHTHNVFTAPEAQQHAVDRGNYGDINALNVLQAIIERGLAIVTDRLGYAQDFNGNPIPSTDKISIKKDPLIAQIGGMGLEGEVYGILGGKKGKIGILASEGIESEDTDYFLPPNDRIVDIREAREALDEALKKPKHAEIAEVARKHHERLFGKKED